MSVTGGMSRVEGGLCVAEAGAEVCAMSPVRTIGGCKSVEIALRNQLAKPRIICLLKKDQLPFLPVSITVPSFDCDEISRDPPTELVVLAIDSRRWYLDAEGLRDHS